LLSVGPWPLGKAMAFAIRDDDLSYFSTIGMVKEVYGHAISLGLKVSFAAVPDQKATNDLNVPPERRGEGNHHRIDHNQELIAHLKDGLDRKCYDIVQHGLAHTERMDLPELRYDRGGRRLVNVDGSIPDLSDHSEFKGLPSSEVESRILTGKQILEQAFHMKVKAFVAPQEYASTAVLRTLRRNGMHYCGGIKSGSLASLRAIRPDGIRLARLMVHRGRGLDISPDLAALGEVAILPATYRHHWSRYTDRSAADESLSKFEQEMERKRAAQGCFVLLTHLWEYFYDWEGGITEGLQKEYLDRQLEMVAANEDVWICGLNELVDWSYRRSRVSVREKADRYVIKAERGISGLHVQCGQLDHSVCRAVVKDNEDGLVVDISPGGQLTVKK
jgi:predicted deacetylase